MARKAKVKKAARAKGKTKAKLGRARPAAKRRPKRTAIRMKRKSVARKQARPKSKESRGQRHTHLPQPRFLLISAAGSS